MTELTLIASHTPLFCTTVTIEFTKALDNPSFQDCGYRILNRLVFQVEFRGKDKRWIALNTQYVALTDAQRNLLAGKILDWVGTANLNSERYSHLAVGRINLRSSRPLTLFMQVYGPMGEHDVRYFQTVGRNIWAKIRKEIKSLAVKG